jgi:CDGSH-type Zn-finger protein
MSELPPQHIRVSENGPYLVSGALPLSDQAIGIDEQDNAWSWVPGEAHEPGERYALCRCGQSSNKPFCDGTHVRVGFDGTETASREPYAAEAERIDGPTMSVDDNEPLCAFARFCDGYGSIWSRVGETDDDASRELVSHEGSHCPSGRLVVRDKQAGGAAVEPDLPPSIVCVDDPQQEVSGPLFVRGGVTVIAADGETYEVRNRVTLCRCGQSSNKPFCDGTHAHVGWRAD